MDFHILGAEQVSGLGDLLHIAVQGIDTAGQEVHHTAGHSLVHVFHVNDDSPAVTQVVSSLGCVVERTGTEQDDVLLRAVIHIQHLTVESGGGYGRGGSGCGGGHGSEAIVRIVLFFLVLVLRLGSAAGGTGVAAGSRLYRGFFLIFIIEVIFILVIIIIIAVREGLCKFLHVIPKAHSIYPPKDTKRQNQVYPFE